MGNLQHEYWVTWVRGSRVGRGFHVQLRLVPASQGWGRDGVGAWQASCRVAILQGHSGGGSVRGLPYGGVALWQASTVGYHMAGSPSGRLNLLVALSRGCPPAGLICGVPCGAGWGPGIVAELALSLNSPLPCQH